MDLEIIILSEVSQTGKDKHHVITLVCGISTKRYKQTYLHNRYRLTDIENKLTATKAGRRGINQEFGISKYISLDIKYAQGTMLNIL